MTIFKKDCNIRNADYSLLLCVARSTEDERQAINLLLEKQAEGIIFFSSSEYRDDSHLLELHRQGLPTVLVNRPNKHEYFVQIHWDQARGVADAVAYLVSLGHRRIAHLCLLESYAHHSSVADDPGRQVSHGNDAQVHLGVCHLF